MKCEKCGKEIPKGFKYCLICNKTSKTNEQKEDTEKPLSTETNPNSTTINNTQVSKFSNEQLLKSENKIYSIGKNNIETEVEKRTAKIFILISTVLFLVCSTLPFLPYILSIVVFKETTRNLLNNFIFIPRILPYIEIPSTIIVIIGHYQCPKNKILKYFFYIIKVLWVLFITALIIIYINELLSCPG